MQKGSALIPIVLAGLLIILIGFYLYSTNKATDKAPVSPVATQKSDINLYSNSKLGFKFEYSKDLTAVEDSEDSFNQRNAGSASKRGNGDFRKNFSGYVQYEPGKFLGAVVVLDSTKSFGKNPLSIWVFDNPNDLSIDVWYGNYWYYPFVWGDFTYNGKIKIAPIDEATVSGKPAKTGIVDYQPGSPKFVYLSKDKKMYLFRVIGEQGNKILSTFKFTQ